MGFLIVGALGYVVDVGAFNILWGMPPFDTLDPSAAKVVAVALAMLVTYLGNSLLTWRGTTTSVRQVLLFAVFNVVGLGCSILTLWMSHDLLGMTSRLDDNVSANVIGVALGTAFRFWSYRHFVFDQPQQGPGTARSSQDDDQLQSVPAARMTGAPGSPDANAVDRGKARNRLGNQANEATRHPVVPGQVRLRRAP